MSAPMTKADLFTLLPADGRLETEQARGRFLAALRLRDAALLPVQWLARLKAWNARRATALALAALPEATLRDIGLSRSDIERVAEEIAVASRAPLPRRAVAPALVRAA